MVASPVGPGLYATNLNQSYRMALSLLEVMRYLSLFKAEPRHPFKHISQTSLDSLDATAKKKQTTAEHFFRGT